MSEPMVIMESFSGVRDASSFRFTGLIEVIVARSCNEVMPALARVEAAVASGRHAAGFISYEAASAINPCLSVLPSGEVPLLWFAIFEQRLAVTPWRNNGACCGSYRTGEWRTSLTPGEHGASVTKVKEYIAAGDTYQVNLTMRRSFTFTGDPFSFYRDLCLSQRAPFCAYLEAGRHRILSASPELFFRLDGNRLITRPMKGTAPRGRWPAEDEEVRQRLREDPKERAENLMIVDLLRNDLGMVSAVGSVEVESLFDVEPLETVHQMTSTISSRIREGAGLVDILRALFPCGSVTGAPKRRTMEIIAELEKEPRGLYTGCIGFLSPGPEAVFSVAIRTVVIDTERSTAQMGIGSGITYDSRPADEYTECLAKGRFALERRPEFRLVETMLHEEGTGIFLLQRHMERLRRSAAYFGFRFNESPILTALESRTAPLSGSNMVRLLLCRNGSFTIGDRPLEEEPSAASATIALAKTRVDSSNPFLYHKTDHRPLYTAEAEARADCIDVIFCNERDEVTEGCRHNLVLRRGEEWITPSLSCGLLPGVLRQELLEKGEVREGIISREELKSATDIRLINSVRRWRRVKLL